MSDISVLQIIYGVTILLALVVAIVVFALAFDFVPRLLQRESSSGSGAILIEHLPNGILLFDASGRIETTNDMLLDLLNCDQESLIGCTRAEFVERYPTIAPTLEADYPIHKPIVIYNRHLEILHHTISSGGELWVFRDVSERITTERMLRVNEQRYRALFDNSNDAIFIISLDKRIEFANEQGARMLGVHLDELLGADVSQYTSPDEVVDADTRLETLLKNGSIPIYERTFIHRDGTPIPCEVTLLLVQDTDGAPMHVQTIVRDISERKRNEEEIRTRLEQLDIMHRMDEEISSTLAIGTVAMIGLDAAVRLSRADAGFFAVADGEDVRIEHYIGQYPTNSYNHVLRHDIGVSGRVLVNQEPELITNVHEDPDYFPDIPTTQALMGLPLISQDNLVGIIILETKRAEYFSEQRFKFMQVLANRIAIAIDNARLYAYVRAQLEEVQELYEELKILESIKTDIIRIASHDLKNPLSVIRGYLELMRMDSDDLTTEHQEFVEVMMRSIKRMQNILEDILSLERINEQTSAEPVELNALVERAIKDYESQAQQKEQTLTTTLTEKTVIIQGSQAQLYEAINNLVGNAIKYTPPGGEIHVKLEANSSQVHFSVEDNGYGIPEASQAKLFQPFYRAKAEGTEHIEGTGLGLHLVKNVIERHGGVMRFQSTEGEGSLFGFDLDISPDKLTS